MEISSVTSVVGKLFDKGWLASRTMWVSIVFDAIYGILASLTLILDVVPMDFAGGAILAIAAIQSQMMKIMRLITKTGILPVDKYKKEQVQLGEKKAEEAILNAIKNGDGVFTVDEPMIKRTGALGGIPLAASQPNDALVLAAKMVPFTITIEQYFKHFPPNKPEHSGNAVILIEKVNALLAYLVSRFTEIELVINSKTGNMISGTKRGGNRHTDEEVGATFSTHKLGMGIDVTDPHGYLDNKITDSILAMFDLYREHPQHTAGWLHVQTKPPGSGVRTYTI